MSEVPLYGSALSTSKLASPPKHSGDVGIAGVTANSLILYKGTSLIRNSTPP